MPEKSNEQAKKPFGRTSLMVMGMILGSLATEIGHAASTNSPTATSATTQESPTQYSTSPEKCPKKSVDYDLTDRQPEVDFALSDDQLTTYSEMLQQSQTPTEAEDILNKVFNKWDNQVFVGNVPQQKNEEYQTRGNSIEHTPEAITQSLINASSVHILESLTRIPNSLLEITSGTDLYLTMGMVGEGGEYSGLYTTDEDDKPVIIVGIGPHDPSGKIYEHELSHALFFKLCGDNIGYNDAELASLNPPGWQYTRKHLNFDDWNKAVASQYGATNSTEDTAELFPQLFDIQMGELCIMNDAFLGNNSPQCNKLDLLLQRIAAKSPEAAAYLAR